MKYDLLLQGERAETEVEAGTEVGANAGARAEASLCQKCMQLFDLFFQTCYFSIVWCIVLHTCFVFVRFCVCLPVDVLMRRS